MAWIQKAKVFPSYVYPSMHKAPWVSKERRDRGQTGEPFQKPHREDPVNWLMAPIFSPSTLWVDTLFHSNVEFRATQKSIPTERKSAYKILHLKNTLPIFMAE